MLAALHKQYKFLFQAKGCFMIWRKINYLPPGYPIEEANLLESFLALFFGRGGGVGGLSSAWFPAIRLVKL